jgi:hypothetical protein
MHARATREYDRPRRPAVHSVTARQRRESDAKAVPPFWSGCAARATIARCACSSMPQAAGVGGLSPQGHRANQPLASKPAGIAGFGSGNRRCSGSHWRRSRGSGNAASKPPGSGNRRRTRGFLRHHLGAAAKLAVAPFAPFERITPGLRLNYARFTPTSLGRAATDHHTHARRPRQQHPVAGSPPPVHPKRRRLGGVVSE